MAKRLKDDAKTKPGVHIEVLRTLISQCDGMKADMDEARGELGAAIKNAEEAHGIHRRAFKLALSLNRMEEAARSDFLRAFDDYRGKLGFNDQGDMFDEAEEGDEAARRAAQAGEETQAAKNAKALKGGITATPPVH